MTATTRRGDPVARHRARYTVVRDRHGVAGYTVALALLVLSYALCATQRSTDPSPFAFLLILATVAVIFHVTAVRAMIQHVAWVVLAAAAVATTLGTVFGAAGHVLDVVFSTASMLALLVAPAAIVAHQAKRRGFNLEALLATITAYVLVGLFFAFLFNLLSLVTSTPMFGEGSEESLSNQLFFSFTTLTTTGYGNIAPVTAGSQAVAVAEAITGQLFLITAVARIMRGTGDRSAIDRARTATPEEIS
ncbi:ion channel [Microbacterium sp. LBN7]|uniref:ion channel n=1 Tax=Microbacterium sp. LBN7 TaxID=3129773 RepID=UPI003245B89C